MLVALAIAGNPCAREAVSVKETELGKVRQKIDALRKSLDADRDQHSMLRGKLKQAEQDIGAFNRSLRAVRAELTLRNRDLDNLQAERRQQESVLASQQDLLARQFRAGYALGRQGYLKLLLSQQNPATVGRTLTYYDYLNRARSDHITQVTSGLMALKTTQTAISLKKGQLEDLSRSQQRQKQDLERSVGERREVIAKLNTEMRGKEQQLKQLTDDEKRLERLVGELQRTFDNVPANPGNHEQFGRLQGKLSWPVSGQVTTAFGSPRPPGAMKWNGVTIAVAEGTEVKGISHGRVAFADWLRGFGLLIIIDHGDGYMSLYGHNQSLFKDVGDRVEQGEVIATVGNSGGHDNAALYFEVRHNGIPKNPAIWCGARRG